MENWRITSGPRRYHQACDGPDIDVGWSWTIERVGHEQPIRVEVAGGRLHSTDLPADSVYAVRTRGRSAVEQCLGEIHPPTRIKVTTVGLVAEYA